LVARRVILFNIVADHFRLTDGHKMVCLDADVNLNPENCTAYSFGTSTDVTFDRAVNIEIKYLQISCFIIENYNLF